MLSSQTALLLIIMLIPLTSLGFLNVLPSLHRRPPPGTRTPGEPTRLLIVLGSGGHTAEMLATLSGLDIGKYTHRSYVVSADDAFSASKAHRFEAELGKTKAVTKSRFNSYDIAVVPRARRVHQGLLTTPWSCFRCFWACMRVLHGHLVRPRIPGPLAHHPDDPVYPDLIVMNGPGTAVVMMAASLAIRFLWLPGSSGKMRTVYVESWARVRRLSLSGKLLVKVVDRFVVQWKSLLPETEGKGEYLGVLV